MCHSYNLGSETQVNNEINPLFKLVFCGHCMLIVVEVCTSSLASEWVIILEHHFRTMYMYILSIQKANTNKLRDNEVLSCNFLTASLWSKKKDQRIQYLFWLVQLCCDQLKLNTIFWFLNINIYMYIQTFSSIDNFPL